MVHIPIDNINIMPPIVGVPCFLRCDFGPSSLSICPTFIFFNIGIIINANTTATAKLIKSIVV